MDLKELNYIVTIADEGSISRAAEKLFMAQSSLSQFLQLYETELGSPLFLRTSKGVRPTASGQAFISRARQILLSYRQAKNEFWDIEELKGGQIELGTATYRGMYLVPPVLKRFHEIYPHVRVSVTEMDSLPLENKILEGLLDLALIALPAVKVRENIDWLMQDEIVLVVSRDHPCQKFIHKGEHGQPDWIRFEDTVPYEYILGPPDTILGRAARREFARIGVEPLTWNTSFTAPFAAALAKEGVALAMSYRSCCLLDDSACYLRIGPSGIFLDLALTYPPGRYRSRATKELGHLFHEMYPASARDL